MNIIMKTGKRFSARIEHFIITIDDYVKFTMLHDRIIHDTNI